MAIDLEVVRRITIEGRVRGAPEMAAALLQLGGAYQGVSVQAGTAERATLSVANALERQRLQIDESHRALRQLQQSTSTFDAARKQGLINEQEHTRLLTIAATRYNEQTTAASGATVATQRFGQAQGLARHDLINLQRQAQDVVVSLQGGQGLGTVLLQQGSQIADVFINSGASVRGFASQAVGWLGRAAVSAAGLTTATLAIGAAALYMGASYSSAQRDVDRALAGQGAASGISRGGINRIAGQAASPFGLSVSEAREAATAFAATGKIYEDNALRASLATKDFARAMGIDASEATKQLAKDLSGDLVGAALKWNTTLGFADAKTIDYIQSLVSMGQRQQAINALITAAAPAIGRVSEQTGKWALAWDFVANKASNAADAIGGAVARGAQRLSGVDFGGFDDQEKLDEARSRKDRFAATLSNPASGRESVAIAARLYREASEEVAKFEQRLADLAKRGENVRFAGMSLEARDFARSINQGTAQVERLSQGLANLEQVQAARINRGAGVDPGLEAAAQQARVQLAMALEQEQVEQRKAQVIAQNALTYQNVAASTAQALAQLQAQLPVAAAVTGQAQLEAQQRATVIALLAQGKTEMDAIAIASAQRAISEAQINAEADRTLQSLREQGELIRSASEEDKARIRAAQEYNRLIEQGVEQSKAGAIAAQMQANARSENDAREFARAEQEAAAAAANRADANERAAQQAAREAEEMDRIIAAAREKARIDAFIPSGIQYSELYTRKDGGKSQFNPEGYKFTTQTAAAMFANNVYGSGGFNWEDGPLGGRGVPNAQGLTKVVSDYLAGSRSPATWGWDSTPSLQNAASGLLSRSGQLGLDPATLQVMQTVTDLMPEGAEKKYFIAQQIEQLKQQKPNIETLQAIKQLEQALAEQTDATDSNTNALRLQMDPLFSQGHAYLDQLRIGFFPQALGGIMTPFGPAPLQRFAGGGITRSPSLFMTSEYNHSEAIVPLPDGRTIPVTMRGGAGAPAPVNNTHQYFGPGSVIVQNPEQISGLSPRQRRQGFRDYR